MDKNGIKTRVRLIIIKNGKILLSYVKDEDFYFYIGGKIEYGGTIQEACEREIKEECNANFSFKKILYVRDYIKPQLNEHSIELYILGTIDKFKEVQRFVDPEDKGNHLQKWVDIKKLLKYNVKPKSLTKILQKDYLNNFEGGISYLGEID